MSRDYRPSLSSTRARSNTTNGTSASSMLTDLFASSSAAPRSATSSSSSVPFQPRIVRGTVHAPPQPSATTARRNRRGSASAIILGPSLATGANAASSSRHGTSTSLGSSAALHAHLKAHHVVSAATNVSPSSHLSLTTATPDAPILIARPAYVAHSALRHYITISPYAHFHPSGHSHFTSPATEISQRRPSARSRMPIVESDDDDDGDDGDSSDSGTGRRTTTSRPPLPAFAENVIHFPTHWNRDDRSPMLNISTDGREVTFIGGTGNNASEREAAAVRANFPMPHACGIYYFEIEVLNKGLKGHIGIGFGTKRTLLSRLPGWGHAPGYQPEWPRESWGYHGDDGNSFASHDHGIAYGPKFSTGDIVGCGVDFTIGRAFYTKNGAFLGHLFENIDSEVYPMVGLRTAGEHLRANFGHVPFKYDIEAHVHLQRTATWTRIQKTPVAWDPELNTFQKRENPNDDVPRNTSEAMQALVMDYLSHQGYARSAEAFGASLADRSSAASSETEGLVISPLSQALSRSTAHDIRTRQLINAALLSGDVDAALGALQANYPRALAADGGWLLFRLRCRKFVELVLEAAAGLKIARKVGAAGKAAERIPKALHKPVLSWVGEDLEEEVEEDGADEEEAMDVDDDVDDDAAVWKALDRTPEITPPKIRRASSGPATVGTRASEKNSMASSSAGKQLEAQSPSISAEGNSSIPAHEHILAYGRALSADYGSDTRQRVQELFARTSSLLAYDDPLEAGGTVSRLAGQEAREELAVAVNEEILASQGRHSQPLLERVFEQASAVVVTLGLQGEGTAAFADAPKEFLRD